MVEVGRLPYFLKMIFNRTSSYGACKCNFPPEIITDRPTNRQTDGQGHGEVSPLTSTTRSDLPNVRLLDVALSIRCDTREI